MTTASQHRTSNRGGSVLLGASAVALLAGVAVVLVGAVAGGTTAAYGALAGTLLVVLVFSFGAGVVHLVAGLAPAASLLVALLTYTLQVVAMALVLAAVNGSEALDGALDRGWLAAAVIAGTLAWLGTQLVLHARLRIPAYDLPAEGPYGRSEVSAG